MRSSTHPRRAAILDRIPEPEVSQELDYLQMLTEEHATRALKSGKRGT